MTLLRLEHPATEGVASRLYRFDLASRCFDEPVRWELASDAYYRVFFNARNGSWTQDLQLRRSEEARCWLAATRVLDRTGTETFRLIDGEFTTFFGEPVWRP